MFDTKLNKALSEAYPPRKDDNDFNDLLSICSFLIMELVRVKKSYDDYRELVTSSYINNSSFKQ